MASPLVQYEGQDNSIENKRGMQVFLFCSLIIFKLTLSFGYTGTESAANAPEFLNCALCSPSPNGRKLVRDSETFVGGFSLF